MVIDTQKAMRKVRALPFCYLCGDPLTDPQNDDHVPPTAIFLNGDRNFPLILPTHDRCNGDRSSEDQVIGQLVGVLHGKAPDARHDKLDVKPVLFEDGTVGAAVRDVDLRAIIRRWVRGFHAALYEEFLPDKARMFSTCPPLPEAQRPNGEVRPVPVASVLPRFVEEIKRNRATGSLDRVMCRNGKCVYECVWAQADRGQWLCVYALDLYGWIKLGDPVHFEARGCVGTYRRVQGGTPRRATTGTRLVFSVENREGLDPFGK
jgi:hypothetical protein